MGLPGKHPADLCQNKDGMNCHNCGGSCAKEGNGTGSVNSVAKSANPEVVAEITKKVMEQLGL